MSETSKSMQSREQFLKVYEFLQNLANEPKSIQKKKLPEFDKKLGISKSNWLKTEEMIFKIVKNCNFEQFYKCFSENNLDHIALKLSAREMEVVRGGWMWMLFRGLGNVTGFDFGTEPYYRSKGGVYYT